MNEVLQELTGSKDVKFNPFAILVDSAGANYCGVEEAYGRVFAMERVRGCQQHFMHNAQIHKRKVATTHQDEWMVTCKVVSRVTTVAGYNDAIRRLLDLARMYPAVGNFVHWWDDRRYTIFDAFRGQHFRRSNLAEPGHVILKRRKGPLWLVEACADDVAQFILDGEKFIAFLQQHMPSTGKGPSQKEVADRARREQMRRAVEFGKILKSRSALQEEIEEAENPSIFVPKGRSKHRPSDPKRPRFTAEVTRDYSGTSVVPIHGRNPPQVTFFYGLNIRVCFGCKQPIDRKIEAPNDMILRLKADRGRINPETRKWQHHIANAYFHLSLSCLKQHNSTLERSHIDI